MDDRTTLITQFEHVQSAWINIDCCVLGCRDRMDFAAIERAGQKLIQLDGAQLWPPIIGQWNNERFIVLDGRHEYLAALALGRVSLFVCWKELNNADILGSLDLQSQRHGSTVAGS